MLRRNNNSGYFFPLLLGRLEGNWQLLFPLSMPVIQNLSVVAAKSINFSACALPNRLVLLFQTVWGFLHKKFGMKKLKLLMMCYEQFALFIADTVNLDYGSRFSLLYFKDVNSATTSLVWDTLTWIY